MQQTSFGRKKVDAIDRLKDEKHRNMRLKNRLGTVDMVLGVGKILSWLPNAEAAMTVL